MMRAQIARESGGASSYLGIHRLAHLPPSSNKDLLYDTTAYINHLETQLKRVTAACEQASDLKEENQAVRELVEEVSARVNAYGANRHDTESRLHAVETLGDRLTNLEVEGRLRDEQQQQGRKQQEEWQEQQRSQNCTTALLERLKSLERVVVEFEMREGEAKDEQQNEVARLTTRLDELEMWCQGLETAQLQGFARLRIEVEESMERFRHEVSMDHHRALSACTKQGILLQEELSRMQKQIAELQRREVLREDSTFVSSQQQMGGERGIGGGGAAAAAEAAVPTSSWQYLEGGGDNKPTTTMADKLEKKLAALNAAFRHAEKGHNKSRKEHQGAITRLQQTLAMVGEKALETSARQAEAVLGVMRQLEDRLAGLETEQQQRNQRKQRQQQRKQRQQQRQQRQQRQQPLEQQFHEGGPMEETWMTAEAMDTISTERFKDMAEERGGEDKKEEEEQEEEEEEEGVITAAWQHIQEQQRLQEEEEEREIEEELMRASSAVLATGAMIGAGGGCKGKTEENTKVQGAREKVVDERGKHCNRADFSAALHHQALSIESTARSKLKGLLRRQGKSSAALSGSAGLQEGIIPNVAVKKKALTPHLPISPPSPSASFSSSSPSSPLRRHQRRNEVARCSMEQQQQQQHQQMQKNRDNKRMPGLLKRGRHVII